jgi:hypothetical protein
MQATKKRTLKLAGSVRSSQKFGQLPGFDLRACACGASALYHNVIIIGHWKRFVKSLKVLGG